MGARLFASTFVLLFLAPIAAAAQEDPAQRAAAQALFDQASALMDKRDYASACPKLEEVLRLQTGKVGVGTLLTLGECYEGAGRVTSAWTMYRQGADRAADLHDDRAAEAQRKADVLARKLPKLSVQVDPATRALGELQVKRDGAIVGAAIWGTAIPVDPGEHTIEATASGFQPFRATMAVKIGESREVVVHLEPIRAAAPVAPVSAAPVVGPRAAPPPPPPPPAPAPAPSGGRSFAVRHRGSLITGGVAVALAAAGTGVGVATWQGYAHLASTCPRPCTSTGTVDAEKTATNVLFGVAGAAAVTSVALFVFAERDRGSVSVGPTGARVLVHF